MGGKAWIGAPWPLVLDSLPVRSEIVPKKYERLGLGYSSMYCPRGEGVGVYFEG